MTLSYHAYITAIKRTMASLGFQSSIHQFSTDSIRIGYAFCPSCCWFCRLCHSENGLLEVAGGLYLCLHSSHDTIRYSCHHSISHQQFVIIIIIIIIIVIRPLYLMTSRDTNFNLDTLITIIIILIIILIIINSLVFIVSRLAIFLHSGLHLDLRFWDYMRFDHHLSISYHHPVCLRLWDGRCAGKIFSFFPFLRGVFGVMQRVLSVGQSP